MFSAYDNQNNKISINDAVAGEFYICPTCKKRLYVKAGGRKKPHFCHYRNESCIDYWKYDESDWSNKWKSSFSNEEVEIIHHEHHIDIEVKNNLGIMFSSSSMHWETFIEKTDYMIRNINNAMWLFNLTDLYEKGTIEPKRDRIIWRSIWKMFFDYQYPENAVWIVVEIAVKDVSWFGILKDLDRSYDDKTLYVLRWLKEDQFRRYFNDIADGKDPEIPYKAEEERQRKSKEEADERERIEREKRQAAERLRREELENQRKAELESFLKKQQEEKEREAAELQKRKEEAEKEAIRQEEAKKNHVLECYEKDPEMKRMSDQLSELYEIGRVYEFSHVAEEWNKKYGFAWLYSDFFH